MPLSKVELYAAIRRDARAGRSGRVIEKKYRVGRRTIVSALASAWPEPRKQLPPRRRPRLTWPGAIMVACRLPPRISQSSWAQPPHLTSACGHRQAK